MEFNIFGFQVSFNFSVTRSLYSKAGWAQFCEDARKASPYSNSQLINQIKLYRELHGTGLRESKNAVEALREKYDTWRAK